LERIRLRVRDEMRQFHWIWVLCTFPLSNRNFQSRNWIHREHRAIKWNKNEK
jgi:hypothetical protein